MPATLQQIIVDYVGMPITADGYNYTTVEPLCPLDTLGQLILLLQRGSFL